jgi:mono/diheme cytochrome c family protein
MTSRLALIACVFVSLGAACSGSAASSSTDPAAASRASSVAALTADTTTGKALYAQDCVSCHGADG